MQPLREIYTILTKDPALRHFIDIVEKVAIENKDKLAEKVVDS